MINKPTSSFVLLESANDENPMIGTIVGIYNGDYKQFEKVMLTLLCDCFDSNEVVIESEYEPFNDNLSFGIEISIEGNFYDIQVMKTWVYR